MGVNNERRREQRRRQRQRFIAKGLTAEGKVRQREASVPFPKALLPKPPELIGLVYEGMTPDQRKLYNDWQYHRHGQRKRATQKKYRESNHDRRALSLKKWRDANKEYVNEYQRQWYAQHPESHQRYLAEARAKRLADPEYIERQALKREKEQKRVFENALAEALKLSLKLHWEEQRKLSQWKRQTQFNPILKIRNNVRSRIYRYLKGLRKPAGTMEIIGCSMAQLKHHLESQFKGAMSWDNYGRAWHVDHIIPCSYFDFSKPEEIRRCYHYSNLRPLWAKTNTRQQDKRGDLTPFLF